MTQKTDGTPTPVITIPLADPSVPFPEMTGGEPCRQDPDFWFPEQGVNAGPPKAFCRTCFVLADCRTWALANPHLAGEGIWGGMSRTERNAVRRNAMRRVA
ncbi:WhiB family transcriptional regulator [Streptomyces sp. NBC_01433]|uniref:WhiB family transcriptional regulator n=1 Tax=Streptomyces sp. NBC_01433 TaxID=2903864 RepID=UPI00225316EA|nr:WhiB family transcriptional regulator [Streptomyces sp. NBC_01433]MCX4682586.1 WhiB family transcriptional regulator [Streptomyces sp. NBC_01433]